jgi:hypothetical protein
MDPLAIVKSFNPLRNLGSGGDVFREPMSVNEFRFEGSKKAFSDCIIPAISFAAHAAGDTGRVEGVAIVLAGILAAPVRMED